MALFTFASCSLRLFIFPNVPVLPSGDQLGFAYDGARIVAGQLPYRDYFQIVPPGTELTYALVVKLFGLHTWTPHLMMAVLAAIATFLLTLISARVLRGPAVVLPGLFLAAFLLPYALDATHHWFSTVAALAALLVLLGGATIPRIAAAGALCGLTACFTQNKGAAVLVAFVIYLAWKAAYENAGHANVPARPWPRQSLTLIAAAAVTFTVINVRFIAAVGIRRWIYCVIVYPLFYYPTPSLNNWRVVFHDFAWREGPSRWVVFPFIYATVPLACIVFLVTTRRRWNDRTQPWPELVLIALTGICMFLAIAPSPSMKRLEAIAPPTMVLVTWMLSEAGTNKASRWRRWQRWTRAALSLLALVMAVGAPIRTQIRHYGYLDLPAGRTAFRDPLEYDEYAWILHHTHPGQFYFGMPMYLPFKLVNPASIDGFEPSEYTRPEQVTDLQQALESHRTPMIILSSTKKYPLSTGLPSDHLAPFRDYLYKNYSQTQTLATGDEAWERKDAPSSIQ